MISSRMSITTYEQSGASLEELLGAWPYQPYRSCPGIGPDGRTAYLLDAILTGQARGAASFLASTEYSNCDGLIQMESLPWDTELLGFPVAHLSWWIHCHRAGEPFDVQEGLLQAAMEEAERRGTRYLLVRAPASDALGIRLLETNQFRKVDALLKFGTVPAQSDRLEPAYGMRCDSFQPADLGALEDIAACSFRFDRFHMDPAIDKDKADQVYRSWIRNSCAGFADVVLVARIDGEVAGFTTLKCDKSAERILGVKIGTIVLAATAAAHRGRGVGRFLTRNSLDWFARQGCQWSEVGTQLANVTAARLYRSAGFQLAAGSLTFRRLF